MIIHSLKFMMESIDEMVIKKKKKGKKRMKMKVPYYVVKILKYNLNCKIKQYSNKPGQSSKQ